MAKAQTTTQVEVITKEAESNTRRPAHIFNTKSKPSLGVGKFVMNLLDTNPKLTTIELLEAVYDHFPEGSIKTTKACISWYKAKHRQTAK